MRSRVAFCRACASTVERFVPTDESVTTAFLYGGAIAWAISRLKYERRPEIARPLSDLLWGAIEPQRTFLSDVVIVPVPLHPFRLAERGFNQAALIACGIARRLGAPLCARALTRTRETAPQAMLDRRMRAANVSGAFVAQNRFANRKVLLVDDVRTTGATLRACEHAIRSAGALHVESAVVAQADG
ncbi:MAG: ComF family protein [Polyangiaceae bacterium]